MKFSRVRFYAELNDFLPPKERYRFVDRRFWTPRSVKDLIESCGVPHTEVDLVLVNGESVDFSRSVTDGDRVSVYPVFEAIDITPVLKLRPETLRQSRFVVDTHLGKLARYLRMLGFDTLYSATAADAELAETSRSEHRILLTRDRGLLMRGLITHGYCVREIGARGQLTEVVMRFDLAGSARPFTRCMKCNGEFVAVDKRSVAAQLPPRVREQHEEIQSCLSCGRLYWEGSHHHRMRQLVEEVLSSAANGRRALRA
ncbi:MAG: Mut7-C ubiquitin/RNAse domain-containing protein [bacterium]|nr:Mut7-C ubiquitin/RNAse domain-containing protein [bacterium]